jgi:hypothetical protein
LIPPQYFADGLTSGPHNVTLTANPAQSGQDNTGKFIDIDRIVVLSTSNGSTTEAKPGAVDAFRNIQNAVQGPTRTHHTKRLNLAIIGGAIASTLFLVLLVRGVAFFCRRRGEKQVRGRPKLSIGQPKTPNMPMHFCPPRGMSPRTPRIHNPDLERGVGHPPTEPQEGNPFTDDAREVWDEYGDCRDEVRVDACEGSDN